MSCSVINYRKPFEDSSKNNEFIKAYIGVNNLWPLCIFILRYDASTT
jgi:hypothetical protein